MKSQGKTWHELLGYGRQFDWDDYVAFLREEHLQKKGFKMRMDGERLKMLQEQGWEFRLKEPNEITTWTDVEPVEVSVGTLKFMATPPSRQKPEIQYREWQPTCHLRTAALSAGGYCLRQQWERFPIGGGVRQTEWRKIPHDRG